jgi:hypothetical protein
MYEILFVSQQLKNGNDKKLWGYIQQV